MKRLYIYIVGIILLLLTSCNKPTEYFYGEKVWVHRANQMDKARALQYQYAGLEIDVFYNSENKCFEIRHDVNEAPLLSLNQWLDSLDNREKLGLWLDLRNLTPENTPEIVSELVALRHYYHLKGKIIVESMSYDCLQRLEQKGFDVSYYIPRFNPDTCTPQYLQMMRDSITKGIERGGIGTISGYHYQYGFMKESFPAMNKLMWYHQYDEAGRQQQIEIANSDPKVKVLLVGVEEW